MKTLQKTLFGLALAGLALQAQAHRPWLMASSAVVDGKDPWVTVDAAISENLFDIDAFPLKLDGLVITGPDGATVAPQNVVTGKLRSVFDVQLTQPGTYKASIVQQNVMGSYTLKGENKRFRATEETLAKEVPAGAEDVKISRMYSRLETFFTDKEASSGVFKPTGVGLELVPVTSPTDLRAGEQATWRFLLDGKPAANQAFSLIPGGVKFRGTLGEIRQNTDAKGEITFALPAAGMYYLSSSWPAATAPVEGQPRTMPARRVSYAATLEVLPQ